MEIFSKIFVIGDTVTRLRDSRGSLKDLIRVTFLLYLVRLIWIEK